MTTKTFTPKQQAIRKQRVIMTLGSYTCTGMLLATVSMMGFLDAKFLLFFAAVALLINGTFYLIFQFNLNRFFKEPDLTLLQMLVCLPPHFLIMIYMTNNQARNALLFVSLIPLLYGILGLTTRNFAIAACSNIAGYLLTLLAISFVSPGLIDWQSEVTVIVGLIVVMIQLPLIGGYISQLRHKLKKNNRALEQALGTISELANKDGLTGVYNRRYLVEQIEHEYDRVKRGAEPFSLILLDMDHFKRINDTHGHLVGDEVLRRCANAFADASRKTDLLGRYGGEEFLLILPQTDERGAQMKAERLREIIENLDFSDVSPALHVTISVGVATHRGDEHFEHTLERADRALYQAKESGRNRVCTADGLQSSDSD